MMHSAWKWTLIYYLFDLVHVKISVWIKASPQGSFLAEPGGKNGRADLNWISTLNEFTLLHMNFIYLISFGSCEVGCLIKLAYMWDEHFMIHYLGHMTERVTCLNQISTHPWHTLLYWLKYSSHITVLLISGLLFYNKSEDEFITFKVHLHCCICDLPGKALVFLHKLYNGFFGCMVC